MSEDKTLLRALCDALSPFVPPEHDVLDAAEAIMAAIGIPAATLSALRSGEMVAVPREPTPDFWPSYCAANGVMPGSAWDTLSQKIYRAIIKHQIAAAKDARHGE